MHNVRHKREIVIFKAAVFYEQVFRDSAGTPTHPYDPIQPFVTMKVMTTSFGNYKKNCELTGFDAW